MPVTFGFALLLCINYELDLFGDVLGVPDTQKTALINIGILLTAMLITGGAALANQLFCNLGLRDPKAAEQKAMAGKQPAKIDNPTNVN